MRKSCPGKPGPWQLANGIPVCRGNFITYQHSSPVCRGRILLTAHARFRHIKNFLASLGQHCHVVLCYLGQPRQLASFSYRQSENSVPANQVPRQSGLKPGYVFSYKQPLKGLTLYQIRFTLYLDGNWVFSWVFINSFI